MEHNVPGGRLLGTITLSLASLLRTELCIAFPWRHGLQGRLLLITLSLELWLGLHCRQCGLFFSFLLYMGWLAGKLNRGLSVVDSAAALVASKENGASLSEEQRFKAAVLGWCIEWVSPCSETAPQFPQVMQEGPAVPHVHACAWLLH